jgi:hypothetical protein
MADDKLITRALPRNYWRNTHMTTKPRSRKPAAKAADPIFAVIAEHKRLEKE